MAGVPQMTFSVLREGDRNEFVFDVKKRLIDLEMLPASALAHADNEIDEFDSETKKALMMFQHDCGLGVDGTVGPQTWYRLMAPNKTRLVQFFNKNIFFNENHKGRNIFTNRMEVLFPFKVDLLRFLHIFSDVTRLTGQSAISVNEFLAHYSIMYNETGGLARLTEMGGPAYMFGTNGGRKFSYNTAGMGNERAGDQLKAKGVISSDADVAKWNGNVYPHDAPEEVKKEALNCDFFKYRGRGLHQLTFRDNYVNYAQSVLEKHGLNMLEMSSDEMDKHFQRPEIYTEVFKNFITKQPSSQQVVQNIKDHGDFRAYGLMVAGNTGLGRKYTEQMFIPRCEALRQSLVVHLKPENLDILTLED